MIIAPFLTSLWHAETLRRIGANTLLAFVIGGAFFVATYCLEFFYRASTDHYRSRAFLHDIFWWFWSSSGLNRLLFTSVAVSFFSVNLSHFHLNLIDNLSAAPRYVLYFVTIDCVVYWIHRWRHENRFLWAFHTTHHAQKQLSFLTVLRVHPVEFIFNDLLMIVPLFLLGAQPRAWFPLFIVRLFIENIQHSRLPWRFGPLYYVLVSPVFHSIHHSTNPEHHGRNFGVVLSLWDFLFGTAVVAKERPSEYGLREIPAPTLLSSLLTPFIILRDTYWPRPDTRSEAPGASLQ